MKGTKKTIEEIKRDLKKSSKAERNLTSKEIVLELAPTIHETMLAGAKLMDLYEIVKAKLPPETRLSPATFKKYWRVARTELGLTPIKRSGRKGPRRPSDDEPPRPLAAVRKNSASDASSVGYVDPDVFWPDD